jgi:hypothetical protein
MKLLHYIYCISAVSWVFPTFSGLPLTPSYGWFFNLSLIISLLLKSSLVYNRLPFGILILFAVDLLYYFLDFHKPTDQFLTEIYIIPLLYVNTYFNFYKVNFKYFTQFSKIIIFGLISTVITTAIFGSIYPTAARDLGGALGKEGNYGLIAFYLTLGIGDYCFSIYWLILGLIFLHFIKTKKKYLSGKKELVVFILFSFGIVNIQYTTPILLFFLGVYLIYFGKAIIEKIGFLSYGIASYIGILITKSFLTLLLISIASIIPDSPVAPRLINVANRLDSNDAETGFDAKNDVDLDKDNIFIGSYERRVNISMNSFLSNPTFGSGESGGHNFFLDFIGKYGLIGTTALIIVLVQFYKKAQNLIRNNDASLSQPYKIIIFIMFILGIIKTYIYMPFVIMIFFFIPLYLIHQNKYQNEIKAAFK